MPSVSVSLGRTVARKSSIAGLQVLCRHAENFSLIHNMNSIWRLCKLITNIFPMFMPGISSVPCNNVYLVLALSLRKIQAGFWTVFIFSNSLFQHIVVPQVQEQEIFWGCKEYFARIFANLLEKLFCTNFPPTNFLQLLVNYIFLNHVAIHTSLFRWQINSTVTKVHKKIYKLIKLHILQASSQVLRLGGGQTTIQRA